MAFRVHKNAAIAGALALALTLVIAALIFAMASA
jgi:hypothetical protein